MQFQVNNRFAILHFYPIYVFYGISKNDPDVKKFMPKINWPTLIWQPTLLIIEIRLIYATEYQQKMNRIRISVALHNFTLNIVLKQYYL